MQCSRTAEHLRCYSLPSCKCIILFSSITGGQSSSSSQQFIQNCRADNFISQKFIRVYRQIRSPISVIHFLSLDKSFHHQPTISSISFPSSQIFIQAQKSHFHRHMPSSQCIICPKLILTVFEPGKYFVFGCNYFFQEQYLCCGPISIATHLS